MDYNEAMDMSKLFQEIGGFTKVEVRHRGFYAEQTPEVEADGKWTVDLWHINQDSGVRHVVNVDNYMPAMVDVIARKAKEKFDAKDKAAFSRRKAANEE